MESLRGAVKPAMRPKLHLGAAAVVMPPSPSLYHQGAQMLSMTFRATVPGNQKILPLPLAGKFIVASASLNHFLIQSLMCGCVIEAKSMPVSWLQGMLGKLFLISV